MPKSKISNVVAINRNLFVPKSEISNVVDINRDLTDKSNRNRIG